MDTGLLRERFLEGDHRVGFGHECYLAPSHYCASASYIRLPFYLIQFHTCLF